MKRYRVRFSSQAVLDFHASFEWGVENWGAEMATKWFAELEKHVRNLLSAMPKAFPTARENSDFEIEVRQLVQGRYRILFTLKADEVLVLRLRGPFTSHSDMK
ncbi:MAG: type II toxin-antitoxin system RelE/ParE family toxin [Pyrinomonadaceae bacterium]